MKPSPIDRPISRRTLLRGATVAGAGALAAYAVGCGDNENGGASPTSTAPDAATGTSPAAPTATTPLPTSASWELIAPEGEAPSARRDHSIVTAGEQLFVFGGRNGGQAMSDLWRLDLAGASWAEVRTDPGPPARFGHNAVWDTGHDWVIVFGGQADASKFFNDLWAYSPSDDSITQLIPTAPDPSTDVPAARYGAAAIFDPSEHLTVTHGFTTQGRFDDTWSLNSRALEWSDVSPNTPRPIERCLTRAVWDSVNDRLIMFGGQTNATPFLGDLWALDAGGWTEITSETKPSPRNFYAMAFDDDRGIAILFGGNSAEGELNDIWVFDPRNETWAEIEHSGEAPSPRQGHDAAWVHGQGLYVFGGNDGSSDLNDLWLLTLS